ncbi:BnaC04g06090D [Brassica napus]|uniref:BnaC04g06090D protein n=2 Tax=Brassica napus TaxID=3708 RepID=A0A078G1K4_BRANA|nr:BnaC04g06090D [Brassica napus]
MAMSRDILKPLRGRHADKTKLHLFKAVSPPPPNLYLTEVMARPDGEEGILLLEFHGNGDRSWQLNFDDFQVSPEHKEKKSPSKLHNCLGCLGPEDNVADYYQQQVEMLEGFTEMDELAERGFVPGMSKEEQDNLAKSETLAIRISNIANMLLFAAKVYASVTSGSLAIVASTLDSLLDLLSGFILWFTAFSMQTPNPYQYPIGKKRMQPLGILVFASVMATLGLQIILESLRTNHKEFSLTKEQRELGGWDHALCYIGQTASCSLLQIVQ